MRKTYRLDGEICPNCASKIQARIERLDGVAEARVNAFTLKFTLDADEDAFDGVLEQSLRAFHKIEPDCEVLVS